MKKCVNYLMVSLCGGLLFLSSCTSYKKDPLQVVIHELSDVDMLNPVNSTDANMGQDIANNIFQPLIAFDLRTLKLVPVLADSLPKVSVDSAGHMLITFEIRKEAKWDNGTPITSKDVEFTFKAIKNPAVMDEQQKPYYDFVDDIMYIKNYSENPRKFTIVCSEKYILSVIASGNTTILPEYVYDPNKYMEHFTIPQMAKDKDKIANDPNMLAFAKEFNSDKFSRDPKYVSGSGAYKFVEWTTGQRLVLEKKKDWWGNSLSGINCFFDANASKLIYQTINDLTSALVSLKAGNLDVMNDIRPQDFIDLPKSDKFMANFNTYTPIAPYYSYLGLNMNNPKFADVRTRRALAHLCDVQRMIKDVLYGLAQPVIGPVSILDTMNYASDIKPYEYNLDTAKALLAAAGWKDSDGDGILDKVIDGKKTDFTIDFLINAGNDPRKKIALIFQEAARKVGITINVIQQDWNVYLDNMKKHNFEMFYGAWVMPYGPQDFKQIYYTTSALNRGSNYVSFGNAKSDALIDSIRQELNDQKRAVLEKKLQGMMHDMCACLYLWSPKQLIAINKRYDNVYPSTIFPGFWEAGFKGKAE
jgi:peptide/nickel transport system substrate-binding protein